MLKLGNGTYFGGKMMRLKRVLMGLILCLPCLFLCSCAVDQPVLSTDKVTVVATLFPQYDFARAIAGDKASVILLLPPGVESHEYEPTPADIMSIREADVFVYSSDQMESWARSLVESSGSQAVVVDASAQNTDAVKQDPHIWTDPAYAKMMVDTIAQGLCLADEMNAGYYRNRADEYKSLLDQLDSQLQKIVDDGERRILAIGGRNAFYHLAHRYNLTIYSAYDSCAEETEPNAQNIAKIIETVKSENLPVIYYEELVDAKIARSVGESTGKPLIMLHSCHNISRDDLAANVTFLDLMRQNASNIAKGLE